MEITTGLLALWVQTAAASEPQPRLIVELVDTTELCPLSIEALRSEVESIYARAGVRIAWGDVLEPARHAARVYLMLSLPSSLDRRLKVRGSAPMAVALGRAGEVSGPTIYVGRSAVTTNLTSGAIAEPDPRLMGRALGRIVAHELAHRYIDREHTRDGILKAGLAQADLQGSSAGFFFTDRQRERLLTIARPPAVTAGSSRAKAP